MRRPDLLPSEAFLCSPCLSFDQQASNPPQKIPESKVTGEGMQETTIPGADVGERMRRGAGEKGRIAEEARVTAVGQHRAEDSLDPGTPGLQFIVMTRASHFS